MGFSYLGEDHDTPHIGDTGKLPFPAPPARSVGTADCLGFSGTVPHRASLPLVGGVDPRCWTEAGLPVPPWSPPVATTNYLAMFTDVSGELVDSPAHFDGVATVIVDGGLTATGTALFGGLILPTSPPASVPAGSYGVYTVPGGAVYLYPPGGPAAPLIAGSPDFLARFNALGDGVETSRIQDTGSGAVSVLAALSVNDLLNLVSTDGGIGAGTIRVFKDTTDGNYLLFTAPGSPASAWAAALKLRADPAGPVLELNSVPAGGTSAVWVDGVPLGSAAFADTGDFDAAGAAATAESNAESYADGVAATAQSNAESYADGVAATAESNAEAYADANFSPLVWSSVSAHQTSNQSLTHDAWNTIQLDSEDSDTLGEYNPSTYTFTPSASGLYAIDFRVSVTGGTTTQIASIWVGTSSELKRIASGASTTFGGVTLVDLTASTGYTFRVFPSPGSPTTVSGASTTSLRIRRLA